MAKSSGNAALEGIKKHYFWIVIPIVLLAGIGITLNSISVVAKKFTDRQQALINKKSAVERIRQEADHPNQKTIDEINKLQTDISACVYSAWTILSRDQKERSVWPAADLGEPFMRDIRGKKPGEEISTVNREMYRNFIQELLPKMVERVRPRRLEVKNPDGKWVPADQNVARGFQGQFGDEGGAAAAGPQETRWEGFLNWQNPEIYRVMDKWHSSMLPGSKEIWLVQEDIWVYDALIDVISKVNANATGIHNATVKCIVNMYIGQQASPLIATISSRRMSTAGFGPGDEGGGGGDMGGSFDSSGIGTFSADGLSADEHRAKAIRDQRYVDQNNLPLGADAPAPFPEFNRMPVCLRLVVDQTKIPEILVACANCAMPMDVLWVRFNPGEGKSFNLTDHYNPGEVSGGGGGGMDHSNPFSSASSETTMEVGGSATEYGAESVAIEIYGVINIFNSPEFTPSASKPADAEEPAPAEST